MGKVLIDGFGAARVGVSYEDQKLHEERGPIRDVVHERVGFAVQTGGGGGSRWVEVGFCERNQFENVKILEVNNSNRSSPVPYSRPSVGDEVVVVLEPNHQY